MHENLIHIPDIIKRIGVLEGNAQNQTSKTK